MRAGQIVDLDRDEPGAGARDRHAALAIAFAMFLAVGGAFVGRDGPDATAPVEAQPALALATAMPPDVVLFTFPDRLANEPPPNLGWVPVRVRNTQGLAVDVRSAGTSIVTWTEFGTVYWISSDRREVVQLVDIADRLR